MSFKSKCLDFAEIIDALRLVPRVLLVAYGSFVLWYAARVTDWFMGLDMVEQTASNASFVTATITAVAGMGTWYAAIYTQKERYVAPEE